MLRSRRDESSQERKGSRMKIGGEWRTLKYRQRNKNSDKEAVTKWRIFLANSVSLAMGEVCPTVTHICSFYNTTESVHAQLKSCGHQGQILSRHKRSKFEIFRFHKYTSLIEKYTRASLWWIGLRIWSCHCNRIPGYGTSTCPGQGQKKKASTRF